MMTRSLLLGATASLALGFAANATTIDGWYIGLEGGGSWIEDWDQTYFETNGAGLIIDTDLVTAEFDTGWAVLATVGYGFGGGWRAELEGGYRDNKGDGFIVAGVHTSSTSLDLSEVTMMLNIIYDVPLTQNVSLSLGAGAGADYAMADLNTLLGGTVDDDQWSFAYQGIAGLNYDVGPHTQLFVNYRYLRASDLDFDYRPAGLVYSVSEDLVKHTATIGLRYSFGAPEAPAPVVAAPPPAAPVEPSTPREYIVFFGHNKSNLTPEALDVVRQAAAAAKEYGSATITVVGHADRSGSTKYNEGLAMRRAGTVKGALVTEGIATGSISVSGKGESEPMVPTADGVREPQNRRVHISI